MKEQSNFFYSSARRYFNDVDELSAVGVLICALNRTDFSTYQNLYNRIGEHLPQLNRALLLMKNNPHLLDDVETLAPHQSLDNVDYYGYLFGTLYYLKKIIFKVRTKKSIRRLDKCIAFYHTMLQYTEAAHEFCMEQYDYDDSIHIDEAIYYFHCVRVKMMLWLLYRYQADETVADNTDLYPRIDIHGNLDPLLAESISKEKFEAIVKEVENAQPYDATGLTYAQRLALCEEDDEKEKGKENENEKYDMLSLIEWARKCFEEYLKA